MQTLFFGLDSLFLCELILPFGVFSNRLRRAGSGKIFDNENYLFLGYSSNGNA